MTEAPTKSAMSIAAMPNEIRTDVQGCLVFEEEVAYYSALPLEKEAALIEECGVGLKDRFEHVYALVSLARDRMQTLANNGHGDPVVLHTLAALEQDVLNDATAQNRLIEIASSLASHAEAR